HEGPRREAVRRLQSIDGCAVERAAVDVEPFAADVPVEGEFVERTDRRRQADRAPGPDAAVREIDALAIESRQRNVRNAPRRIDLNGPLRIVLREQTITDAIPLTRMPRQCDDEVLHASQGNARGAAA